MPSNEVTPDDLRVVERLVREAGQAVAHFYAGDVAVSFKGIDDPVTAADHAANDCLMAGLAAAFPGDGLLSEESADDLSRLDQRRVWIVDPLDGTKEFIGRIGEFSIMVGLAIAGRPALGVVYQPVADVLYRAIPGKVAEVVENGAARSLAVSDIATPQAMSLVASRSHRDPLVAAVCLKLGITQDRPSGSVGLKVGLLATAVCDLYIHPAPGLKEWDTCAPEAVLAAAGGTLTDAWGQPLRYNKPNVRQRQGLVASNGCIHDRIVAATSEAAETAGFAATSGFW